MLLVVFPTCSFNHAYRSESNQEDNKIDVSVVMLTMVQMTMMLMLLMDVEESKNEICAVNFKNLIY